MPRGIPNAAKNSPAVTQFAGAVHSEDVPLTQKSDIDLDAPIIHSESLPDVGDKEKKQYLDDLAFNEEPVTIIIEENARSDFPETHVPVAVQGKNAEVFMNGGWVEVGWLPIGHQITTKRKYVEILLRSKTDSVKTEHDDATVERPRNMVKRRTSAAYPVTILEDRNPRGGQWLTKIRMEH